MGVALVVRFDVRDEASAARFDELTAEVVAAIAAHEPLLAGEPRVELLVAGVGVAQD